tara:strand:- start:12138 stop:12650 length:513 start_codon:yes stop_codon:yes gene_type:complete
MSKEYKELYLKYKKKFLKLHDQLGGDKKIIFNLKGKLDYKRHENDLEIENNNRGVGVHYNLGIPAKKFKKDQIYSFLIFYDEKEDRLLFEKSSKINKKGIIIFESIVHDKDNNFIITYSYKAKTSKGMIKFRTKIYIEINSFDNKSDKFINKKEVRKIDEELKKFKKEED